MRVLPDVLTDRPVMAALLFVTLVPCASGPLPKRVEKCLPYPTLSQEIKAAQPTEPAPALVRVHVLRVEFNSDDGIPADVQEEISTELEKQVFGREANSAYLNHLAQEIGDVAVRKAFRNRGYFKVSDTASLTTLSSEGADIYVAAEVHATPGPQYRAGDIRVESEDPDRQLMMSHDTLRGIIPLQKGELFSVERVRTGLENLGRLYARQGYIDMTPEPETQVNDENKTVDLVVKIDQQVQYRVGSIEFLGVSNTTQVKLMDSLPKPGEIFDRPQLNEFFRVNRATLPSDASEGDVSRKRNNKEGTVDILFDLRTCPSDSN